MNIVIREAKRECIYLCFPVEPNDGLFEASVQAESKGKGFLCTMEKASVRSNSERKKSERINDLVGVGVEPFTLCGTSDHLW